MIPYPKTLNIFKRDPENNFKTVIDGAWAIPEFEYLKNCDWIATEKVDGMNIRVHLNQLEHRHTGQVVVQGRTDRAEIKSDLIDNIHTMFADFTTHTAPLAELFPSGATLYGEGYGLGIQKGGGQYRDDKSFVLFDVMINGTWLSWSGVVKVANYLGIHHAPVVNRGALPYIIDFAADGFNSMWGPFPAEGVIVQPEVPMFTQSGQRIKAKIKTADFA